MKIANTSIVILLNHLGETLHPYAPVDGTYTLLPTMDAGYKILLRRFTEPYAQKPCHPDILRSPSLPSTKNTRLSEHGVCNSGPEVDKIQKTGLSHTVNNVNGKPSPVKRLQQSPLLPLFILLLLVPGFLLFVKHICKGDSYDRFTISRDQDRSGWDEEKTGALIDEAGSASLQTVAVMEDNPEVAKCKGWRDWVDYESGWTGCVP